MDLYRIVNARGLDSVVTVDLPTHGKKRALMFFTTRAAAQRVLDIRKTPGGKVEMIPTAMWFEGLKEIKRTGMVDVITVSLLHPTTAGHYISNSFFLDDLIQKGGRIEFAPMTAPDGQNLRRITNGTHEP